MKYISYTAMGLTAVILVYAGFLNREETKPLNEQKTDQPMSINKTEWETRTDEQSGVVVKVTPVEIGGSASTWKFDITLETHAGSLDQDLMKIASLSDNASNTYQPTAWEGPGPGGHHREGILIFKAIDPAPSFIELNIKSVGEIPEHSFKWSLE